MLLPAATSSVEVTSMAAPVKVTVCCSGRQVEGPEDGADAPRLGHRRPSIAMSTTAAGTAWITLTLAGPLACGAAAGEAWMAQATEKK